MRGERMVFRAQMGGGRFIILVQGEGKGGIWCLRLMGVGVILSRIRIGRRGWRLLVRMLWVFMEGEEEVVIVT